MSNVLPGTVSQKEINKQQQQQQQQQCISQTVNVNGVSHNTATSQISSTQQHSQNTQQQLQTIHNSSISSNNSNSNTFATHSPHLTSSSQQQRKMSFKIQLKPPQNASQSISFINQVVNQPTLHLTNQQQTSFQQSQSGLQQPFMHSQFHQQSQWHQGLSAQLAVQQQQQQQQSQQQQQVQLQQSSSSSSSSTGFSSSGQQSGSLQSTAGQNNNNNNGSVLIKKSQQSTNNDDNGMYFSQKKKLLEIIQKQQREQQEFDKQQQQAVKGAIGVGIVAVTSEEIMQEAQKNHKRNQWCMKTVKVITSPVTKNKSNCIRNLLKKYKRNIPNIPIPREETISQNTAISHFMSPQVQQQQQQVNSISSTFSQICLSPLKRPHNGMHKDGRFSKNPVLPQGDTNSEEQEQQEDSLQDTFEMYHKILDEDELAFLKEIEDACVNQPNNINVSGKFLFNKNINKLITSNASSQSSSISSGISPQNNHNNSKTNEGLHLNSLCSNQKENDYPKVKESSFKRIVKSSGSVNQASIIQIQQATSNDISFEKKNDSSNSEFYQRLETDDSLATKFFQRLETDDSLATTQLSALSNCTPHSLSQNLFNFFSPLNNNSNNSAGSTINFNNTNSSLKQAIQSLSWQNGENNSLIYEQIKLQIDTHNEQQQECNLKLQECNLNQQDIHQSQTEEIIGKQQLAIPLCNKSKIQVNQNENVKKTKVITPVLLKNSIQSLLIQHD